MAQRQNNSAAKRSKLMGAGPVDVPASVDVDKGGTPSEVLPSGVALTRRGDAPTFAPSALPSLPQDLHPRQTPTKTQIRTVQRIYNSIPQEELIEALHHGSDPRYARLLEILSDDAYTTTPFAFKCRNAGISPSDVWQLVISLHKLDGEIRLARRVPEMMEKMAEEAIPRLIKCPANRCRSGKVYKTDRKTGAALVEDCPKCDGAGELLVSADTEKLKMSLEAAGVLGQRGPLIDARQVHLGGGSSSGVGIAGAPDMSDWSRLTDDAMEERGAYHRPPAQEGEVIE